MNARALTNRSAWKCFVRGIGVAALALGCLAACERPLPAAVDDSPQSAQPLVLLTGTVKSPSGEPMTGVTVSAKLSGTPVVVSVYSDAQGDYHFPPLHKPGRYVVWAQAVGFERRITEVDIGAHVARADLVLHPTTDILNQLSGWQQLMGLPEDTRAHRRGKAIVAKACTGCHQSSKLFAVRFDEQGWLKISEAMARAVSSGSVMRSNIEQHKQEIAAYLAEMSGPEPSPARPKIPPRPTGVALLPVIYEYDIPNHEGQYPFSNGSNWTQGVPAVSGTGGGLHDATADQDGNLWFSSIRNVQWRTIGKIDGITGATTSYAYPAETANGAGRSHAITTASDGTIWFTLAFGVNNIESHLGFVDPRTSEQRYYSVPKGMDAVGGWLNEDGKGNIWTAAGAYSGRAGALVFDRATRTFRQFKSISDGMTYGVAGDRSGNGWWTQINVDIIGYSDVSTGESFEIRLPFTWDGTPFLRRTDMTPSELVEITSGIGPVPGGSQMPRRPRANLRTDDVWVPNYTGNNLLRINSKTLEQTYYQLPYPLMGPYDVGIDRLNTVWVAIQNGDEIANFDPVTQQWTLYPLPTKGVSARSLNVIERNGTTEIIVAENDVSRIGRMILRSAQQVAELKQTYARQLREQND